MIKSQIKTLSLLLLSVSLLSACASTEVKEEPVGNKIKSVSASMSNRSIPNNPRASSITKLSSDLSLNTVVKNYKGKMTVIKNAKVTQAQFDSIVKELEMLDISKLKSSQFRSMPGGGRRSISVETNAGTYQFFRKYPPAIARLSRSVQALTAK